MTQHITRNTLHSFAATLGRDAARNIIKAAASIPLSGSTFLSHSSKDEDLVPGAILFLEHHGAKVYVDEIDPEMPPYTSEHTAQLLKTRIRDTSRFVLLASKNSKDSKWVPWELGVADGVKDISKIALFPASDSVHDQTWASWEYLGLYNRIVWGKLQGYQQDVWMVLDEKKNIATELSRWFKDY